MRTQPVGLKLVNFSSGEAVQNVTNDIAPVEPKVEKPENNKKALPLVTAALAVVSLGVSAYALHGKGKSKAAEEGKKLAEEGKKLAEEAKAKAEEAAKEAKKAAEEQTNTLNEKVESLTSELKTAKEDLESSKKWYDGWVGNIDNRVRNVEGESGKTLGASLRYAQEIDGYKLMRNIDNDGTPILLKTGVAKKIEETAQHFISGKGLAAAPVLAAGAAIWLPTAESKPEKEGGLGEVPVQLASNYIKEFGLDAYILRPIIENKGVSYIREVDGEYRYWYQKIEDPNDRKNDPEGKNRDKWVDRIGMRVDKVMEFDMPVVRNGQYENTKVEVFYGKDPANGYKRIMFRNPTYFAAKGLYKNSQSASEPERYAAFDKMLYEFTKIKKDPKAMTSYRIFNEDIYESIKVPDAVISNDWHTASYIALMRMLAPVEASNGELNAKVADEMSKMNILHLVHNNEYQGQGGKYSSDMLNTLFGSYAYDIYNFAKTGFKEQVKDENGYEKEQVIESLKSVLAVEGQANMANMAMATASKVKPVSNSYGLEMANDQEIGHALTHIASERSKTGSLQGQSNGWDKSANEVSQAKLPMFNKMANDYKIKIFLYNINQIAGLTPEQRKKVDITSENIDSINFNNVVDSLYALSIPKVTETLEKLKNDGATTLHQFKAETDKMSMDEIMEARKHNKKILVASIKDMVEFNKKYGKVDGDKELFPIGNYDLTDLSDIDIDNLDNVPVFNMGVRFVGQKGVNIACAAWEYILNNWETLFPGKPYPIVLIGGDDAEGGIYWETVSATKKRLGDKGKHLVLNKGFTPNPVWTACSDWTMRPSWFEPDGDKWESLYKGTPCVMTSVGGHIDSIQDGINGIRTKRTMKQIRDSLAKRNFKNHEEYKQALLEETAADYKDALIRSLKAFNDGKEQRRYVDNAIHGEQSWVQKDSDGKIVECPALGHLRDLGFDLSTFPQISTSVKDYYKYSQAPEQTNS